MLGCSVDGSFIRRQLSLTVWSSGAIATPTVYYVIQTTYNRQVNSKYVIETPGLVN